MSASEAKNNKTAKIICTIVGILSIVGIVIVGSFVFRTVEETKQFYKEYCAVLEAGEESEYPNYQDLCTRILEKRKSIEISSCFIKQTEEKMVYYAIDKNDKSYFIPIISEECDVKQIMSDIGSYNIVSVDFDGNNFVIFCVNE